MAGRQGPADLRQMLAADQKRRDKRQQRGRQQPAGEEGWHAGKDGEGRYASAAPSQTASSDGPLHREAAGEAAVEVEKAAASAAIKTPRGMSGLMAFPRNLIRTFV